MRDIRSAINELYHQDLPEELLSSITDSVNDRSERMAESPT